MRLIRKILNLKYLRPYLPVDDISIKLRGDNVHCVCCGGRFLTFLPYGLIKRANAKCPNCGSLERHRLIWHYLINRTDLLQSDNVLRLLHVAPEKVFYNKFAENSKIGYVPCAKFGEGYRDVYPEKTIDVDITDIKFADNSFDVIFCSHVLEHVPEDIKAMKEFYRVLKPGGWAILQVPLDKNRHKTYEDFSIVDSKERERAFGQHDHVRIYGTDYMERLILAGFAVNKTSYTDEFTPNEIFQNGFLNGEEIFMCTKR